MSLSVDQVRRVVHTVWSTQLGLDLVDAEIEVIEAGLTEQNLLDVAARFSGDFNGLLVQRCSLQLSLRAADTAFAANNDDIDVSDARDTLIELANMTAGNLKAVLPGSCDASIPVPIDHVPDSNPVVVQAGFLLQGEPLIITVYSLE